MEARSQSKSTYGTGCFLLYHTGDEPVLSRHGLLTTIGYKASPDSPPQFALEGSMAAGGSSVKWVRDRLGLINEVSQIGPLAAQVEFVEIICLWCFRVFGSDAGFLRFK